MMAVIQIFIGSISDKDLIKEATEILDKFNVAYDFVVASAHRTPDFVVTQAKSAREKGIKVIIAAAGGAAHLAGNIAANTLIPVIGIPISNNPLNGLDSLLSTVQMPSGIPVATVAINGAQNAALLALEILAINDQELYEKLVNYRKDIEKSILEHNNNNDKL